MKGALTIYIDTTAFGSYYGMARLRRDIDQLEFFRGCGKDVGRWVMEPRDA